MGRSLEYLVTDLVERLDDYFSFGGPDPILHQIAELKSVLRGEGSSQFETWVVSFRGTVAHLWNSDQSSSYTMCGYPLHKDAYQLFCEPESLGRTKCRRCWNLAATAP